LETAASANLGSMKFDGNETPLVKNL
jgi:hypothetical protein